MILTLIAKKYLFFTAVMQIYLLTIYWFKIYMQKIAHNIFPWFSLWHSSLQTRWTQLKTLVDKHLFAQTKPVPELATYCTGINPVIQANWTQNAFSGTSLENTTLLMERGPKSHRALCEHSTKQQTASFGQRLKVNLYMTLL